MSNQYKSQIENLKITTPLVVNVMTTIKQIQKRMKDPDIVNLEYSRTYDILSKEFDDFFKQYTSIFIKVTRGESLAIISAELFYLNKVAKGEMQESEMADLLATKFMPTHLKEESDLKLKELKEQK
jgi:hypothetical protein